MKVCELCAVDFTAYHLLRPLGVALREGGIDVWFCSTDGGGLRALEREGFKTYAVPISRNYNVFAHLVSLFRLVGLFRRERFDIVHAHTPIAGLIGRVAARIAGVPVVIYTAHGFYFHENMHGLVKKLFVAVERFGARLSDVVFVQSREDYEEALSLGIAPENKLIHIGNGVDIDKFDRSRYEQKASVIRGELSLGEGPVVGFVGRIVREKGAVEFVKAASMVAERFPSAEFVMIGEPLPSDRDGCFEEVQRLKKQLNLGSRLKLVGYRRDVAKLMSVFDVFVLPSYREGMPRSLIEAMATGLPVVATDIRGCREEVEDRVNGILVPPRSHEALAEAVAEILSDGHLRSEMGARGRERARRYFDERDVIERQTREIGKLIASKNV
ncbi:glycosyltransferase family 1 protein [bacterium]|nr:MAG: glycosyltransferase family 1 protein [bacterium]